MEISKNIFLINEICKIFYLVLIFQAKNEHKKKSSSHKILNLIIFVNMNIIKILGIP